MRACATGCARRRRPACPARRMSPTNWPRPRIRRSSSLRGSRAPTPCPAPGPPAGGNSRSLRTVTFSSIELTLTSLRRNGLRQDWRDRVVSRAGAQAERRLQQTLGDDFIVLVVAKDKAAGSSPSTETSASMPTLSVPISSARPSILAGLVVTIGTTCSSVRPSAIIELMAWTRLNLAWPANGWFSSSSCWSGVPAARARGCCSRACRRRACWERCRRRAPSGETIGEMAAVADVDLQAAIERRLNHGCTSPSRLTKPPGWRVNGCARTSPSRSRGITRSRIVSTSSPLVPLSGRPQSWPKWT